MRGAEFLKASIFKHCSSTFPFPYTTFELVCFAGCFLVIQCYPTQDVCLLAPGANDFFSDAKGETHQCLMEPAFSVIKEVPLGWFRAVYIFPCKFTGSHEPALQVVQSHNVEVRSTKGYFGPFMLQHSSQLIKVNTEVRLLESHTENCTVGLFRFRGYLFLSFWLGLDFSPAQCSSEAGMSIETMGLEPQKHRLWFICAYMKRRGSHRHFSKADLGRAEP